MYSTDNKGQYPLSLNNLVPGYLKTIPSCPSTGEDTYSKAYISSQKPDAFTVWCSGDNHKEVNAGKNYPLYSSSEGLIAKGSGYEPTLQACELNLKNIANALEMYASDNEGNYPRMMEYLVPDYLKTIPACPEAGRDTYSITYRTSRKNDVYTFYCFGRNHAEVEGIGENYPLYSSKKGLIAK